MPPVLGASQAAARADALRVPSSRPEAWPRLCAFGRRPRTCARAGVQAAHCSSGGCGQSSRARAPFGSSGEDVLGIEGGDSLDFVPDDVELIARVGELLEGLRKSSAAMFERYEYEASGWQSRVPFGWYDVHATLHFRLTRIRGLNFASNALPCKLTGTSAPASGSQRGS